MPDLNAQLGQAENALRELQLGDEDEREVEFLTIDILYDETPRATYRDTPYGEPFYHPELKRWFRCRVRHPLEQTAGEVTQ
jgi:hypothetical protein